MIRLPRELVQASGLRVSELGDISHVPAYKLYRATRGEACLSTDEFNTVTHVLGVYTSNRKRAAAMVATKDLVADTRDV